MVMLAEHYDYVIGGDPDRDTIDLAVVTAPAGRVVAHRSDQTGEAGYLRLVNWGRERGRDAESGRWKARAVSLPGS